MLCECDIYQITRDAECPSVLSHARPSTVLYYIGGQVYTPQQSVCHNITCAHASGLSIIIIVVVVFAVAVAVVIAVAVGGSIAAVALPPTPKRNTPSLLCNFIIL